VRDEKHAQVEKLILPEELPTRSAESWYSKITHFFEPLLNNLPNIGIPVAAAAEVPESAEMGLLERMGPILEKEYGISKEALYSNTKSVRFFQPVNAMENFGNAMLRAEQIPRLGR
jgi:hypothetical protein